MLLLTEAGEMIVEQGGMTFCKILRAFNIWNFPMSLEISNDHELDC